MPAFGPSEVMEFCSKVIGAAPSDIKLVAQRLHDHAFEPRLSAEGTKDIITELGYENLETFCADLGLSSHIAERWSRFGISHEMKQVITLLVAQRRRMAEAVAEFEDMTHVGVEDFLRDRGVI
jgi:hypothetical protein